jgi:TetR/AcrR family transcriptional regulator, cholesterol catabolism regulator
MIIVIMSAAPGNLRQRNKEDKRQRLCAAASLLFESAGYEATTTRAIAERAGVATGTLFLYADDKADLLFLVFHDELKQAFDQGIASLPPGSSLQGELRHLVAHLFEVYGKHPKAAAPFLGALPFARSRNAVAMNSLTIAFLLWMGERVEAAKARGEVRADVEASVAAQNFFAFYFYALMSWASGVNTLEDALGTTFEGAVALQLVGLVSEPSKQGRSQ